MISFGIFQQSSYVFAFFYSIYCICVGNFDTSEYYLPLRLATPFSIDSLLRWYLLWTVQAIGGISYLCGTMVVTSYFVCCYYYLEAFCDHFDYLIESVDAEFGRIGREANEEFNWKNSLNARKLLSNAIDHHIEIYE